MPASSRMSVYKTYAYNFQFTTMVQWRAEIALVCGSKVWVGCQNRLTVNSDADETQA